MIHQSDNNDNDVSFCLACPVAAHEAARAEASSSLRSFQNFIHTGDLLEGQHVVDAPDLPNVEEVRKWSIYMYWIYIHIDRPSSTRGTCCRDNMWSTRPTCPTSRR
jgi:hypothetical protein